MHDRKLNGCRQRLLFARQLIPRKCSLCSQGIPGGKLRGERVGVYVPLGDRTRYQSMFSCIKTSRQGIILSSQHLAGFSMTLFYTYKLEIQAAKSKSSSHLVTRRDAEGEGVYYVGTTARLKLNPYRTIFSCIQCNAILNSAPTN